MGEPTKGHEMTTQQPEALRLAEKISDIHCHTENEARAIAAAETQSIDLQQWKLADNAWAEVTTAELRQALAMAFQAQSELWA